MVFPTAFPVSLLTSVPTYVPTIATKAHKDYAYGKDSEEYHHHHHHLDLLHSSLYSGKAGKSGGGHGGIHSKCSKSGG